MRVPRSWLRNDRVESELEEELEAEGVRWGHAAAKGIVLKYVSNRAASRSSA